MPEMLVLPVIPAPFSVFTLGTWPGLLVYALTILALAVLALLSAARERQREETQRELDEGERHAAQDRQFGDADTAAEERHQKQLAEIRKLSAKQEQLGQYLAASAAATGAVAQKATQLLTEISKNPPLTPEEVSATTQQLQDYVLPAQRGEVKLTGGVVKFVHRDKNGRSYVQSAQPKCHPPVSLGDSLGAFPFPPRN